MKTKNLFIGFLMLFISEISFAQVTFQKTFGELTALIMGVLFTKLPMEDIL